METYVLRDFIVADDISGDFTIQIVACTPLYKDGIENLLLVPAYLVSMIENDTLIHLLMGTLCHRGDMQSN